MKIKNKILIKPYDAIYSVQEKDDFSNLFIMPIGEEQINEMWDTIYIKDAFVRYHTHDHGFETWTIDRGSVEITIRGMKSIAHEGDMIHIRPYVPHGFKFLEEGTIWRELFQGIKLYQSDWNKVTLGEHHPELLEDAEFMKQYRAGNGTFALEEPKLKEVPKDDISEIRVLGSSLCTFEFEGVTFKQKVGRWETDGVKEIWELIFEKDVEVKWEEPHRNYDLFVVTNGSIELTVEDEIFVATKRDIINIPPYKAYKMKMLEEGTSIYTYNCQSMLYRILEELTATEVNSPEKIEDWNHVKDVLRKNNCFVTGFEKIKE